MSVSFLAVVFPVPAEHRCTGPGGRLELGAFTVIDPTNNHRTKQNPSIEQSRVTWNMFHFNVLKKELLEH